MTLTAVNNVQASARSDLAYRVSRKMSTKSLLDVCLALTTLAPVPSLTISKGVNDDVWTFNTQSSSQCLSFSAANDKVL